MIAQASRAGIGLAYVGESIVADDIASGRLVEVLNEWRPSYPGYCLYYPGRRYMAASLRAFIHLAQKIVSGNRAKACCWMSGGRPGTVACCVKAVSTLGSLSVP